jgi:HSP20 family protein
MNMSVPLNLDESFDASFEINEGQLAVDVMETAKEIIIQAAVAGVLPEDLDVHVTNDLVTIRGARKQEIIRHSATMHFEECFWGTFSRSIILPHHVKPDETRAAVKQGILTLTIPKTSGDMHIRPDFSE